jgi:eukaryotic-like serine/threonine-protein kinase
MDDLKKINNSGMEDETAFAETLITDQTLADGQEHSPKVNNSETNTNVEKTVSKQPAWVGKNMGHFKLLRLIGRGSMGMVIQAEDINLKRIVALKVLRKQFLTNGNEKNAIEQFLREARAAAAIEHPNIVRVFEINQHSGWWYIAMEMVAGTSLKEIIKAAGALPVSRACPIIADVAVGLQAVHKLGIIHRDIKPSNILVTRNGHGKVSDFGLVRIDDPNDPFDIFAQQSIGTPLYIAPEIVRRETISTAVDIYSLGATLYHTLTGHPPYIAKKINDILNQHLNADPPNLQKYLSDCSLNLASLIQRMMAKEPDSRPAAAEVAAILHSESIVIAPETSGIIDTESSTLITPGILKKNKILPQETIRKHFLIPLFKRFNLLTVKYKMLWGVLFASVIILFLGLVFFLYTTRNQPRQYRRSLRKLFPESPSSYGIENPDISTSLPSISTDIPAFSWKDKVDVSTFKFVASKSGHYFYSIEDKRAVLIRADQFIGYQAIEQAIKDGKEPAP